MRTKYGDCAVIVGAMVFKAKQCSLDISQNLLSEHKNTKKLYQLIERVNNDIMNHIGDTIRFILNGDATNYENKVAEMTCLMPNAHMETTEEIKDVQYILSGLPNSNLYITLSDGTIDASPNIIGVNELDLDATVSFFRDISCGTDNVKCDDNIYVEYLDIYAYNCVTLGMIVSDCYMGAEYVLNECGIPNPEFNLSTLLRHSVMTSMLISEISKDIILPGYHFSASVKISDCGDDVMTDVTEVKFCKY